MNMFALVLLSFHICFHSAILVSFMRAAQIYRDWLVLHVCWRTEILRWVKTLADNVGTKFHLLYGVSDSRATLTNGPCHWRWVFPVEKVSYHDMASFLCLILWWYDSFVIFKISSLVALEHNVFSSGKSDLVDLIFVIYNYYVQLKSGEQSILTYTELIKK